MRGAAAALCVLLSLGVVEEAAAFSGVSPVKLRDSRAARSPDQQWHGVTTPRHGSAAMIRPARLHAEERHRTRFAGSLVSMVASAATTQALTLNCPWNRCPPLPPIRVFWRRSGRCQVCLVCAETRAPPPNFSADLPKFYNPTGKFDTVKLYEGRLHNIHHFWEYMATLCPNHLALTDETHDGG